MVIPYGFIEAVIKRDELESTKKCLSLEFIKEYNLDKARYDDNLIIVPIAMSGNDAELKAKELETKYGLVHYTKNGRAQDFVICHKKFGNFDECDWLIRAELQDDMVIDNTTYKKHTPYYKLKEEK